MSSKLCSVDGVAAGSATGTPSTTGSVSLLLCLGSSAARRLALNSESLIVVVESLFDEDRRNGIVLIETIRYVVCSVRNRYVYDRCWCAGFVVFMRFARFIRFNRSSTVRKMPAVNTKGRLRTVVIRWKRHMTRHQKE